MTVKLRCLTILCTSNPCFVLLIALIITLETVPAGSPSHDRNVAVYVFDIYQRSLPILFHSVLVSISVFMALSTVFHSINSPDNSPFFSLRYSGLISALLVLST